MIDFNQYTISPPLRDVIAVTKRKEAPVSAKGVKGAAGRLFYGENPAPGR
jgi:hypothetical protein